MPNVTYPNQRMVYVHREAVKTDFLGIRNDNWKAAARDLSAHAFKLYIYLASNANNYTLALSPAAVRQEIGMARSTYHDQFHVLLDKGYLVPSHGNTFDFYEVPRPVSCTEFGLSQDGLDFENGTSDGQAVEQAEQTVLPEDIEINIDNPDSNTNTSADLAIKIPEVREITISVPDVTTPKREQLRQQPPKQEFVF